MVLVIRFRLLYSYKLLRFEQYVYLRGLSPVICDEYFWKYQNIKEKITRSLLLWQATPEVFLRWNVYLLNGDVSMSADEVGTHHMIRNFWECWQLIFSIWWCLASFFACVARSSLRAKASSLPPRPPLPPSHSAPPHTWLWQCSTLAVLIPTSSCILCHCYNKCLLNYEISVRWTWNYT